MEVSNNVPWQDDSAVTYSIIYLLIWRRTREPMVFIFRLVVAKRGRNEPLIVQVAKEEG